MREIERTTQFRRDYKREAKGPHRTALADDLAKVLGFLVGDRPLPPDIAIIRSAEVGAESAIAM